MPAIGTSSDLYQHRDPALTTYRRNAAAPTLAEAMAEHPRERLKAATKAAGLNGSSDAAGTGTREAGQPVPEKTAASLPAAGQRDASPVTPQKFVHELYAPPSRTRREHDDRHAMITGGTIDVRA